MIKVCIFDLDGTIYNFTNPITKCLDEKIGNFIKVKSAMSEKEFKRLEERIPDVIDALKELNLDKKEYYNYIYSDLDYDSFFKLDESLRRQLQELNCIKVICSNSSCKHVEHVIKRIGIEEEIDEIFSMEKENNKKSCYENIIEKYCMKPNDIIVVGNDFNVDIKPAIQLGCNTILVSSKKDDYCENTVYDCNEAILLINELMKKKSE